MALHQDDDHRTKGMHLVPDDLFDKGLVAINWRTGELLLTDGRIIKPVWQWSFSALWTFLFVYSTGWFIGLLIWKHWPKVDEL